MVPLWVIRISEKSWRNCIVCNEHNFGRYEWTCTARRMIRMSRWGARLPSVQATATYWISLPSLSLFLHDWPGCCFLLAKSRHAHPRRADAATELPARCVRHNHRRQRGSGFGREVVWGARATAFSHSLKCRSRHTRSCLCGEGADNVGGNGTIKQSAPLVKAAMKYLPRW